MKSHRKAWKLRQADELSKLFGEHKIVGIADLLGTPASLIQKLRKALKGKAVLKVSKTRVAKKALEGVPSKKALDSLVSKSCLVIFSQQDPFELYSLIKKNRAKAFAKAGYVAEEDIVIPAGDTGLPPGPALSDLKAAGLQIKIQGPTIHITADKVVTKKGETVTPPVANVLSKLDIKPVKVGLKVTAFYENGVLFGPGVLDVDSEKVFNDFAAAYIQSLNLSVNAAIFNAASMPIIVGNSFRAAKAVALAGNVLTKETMPELLAKASMQAKAIEGMASQKGEQP